MVKHIILWQFSDAAKESGTKEAAALLRGKFKALLGVVDGLLAIELGEDVTGNTYDMALYCEFRDMESLEGYQVHPDHLEIKKLVKVLAIGRTCVDYEV